PRGRCSSRDVPLGRGGFRRDDNRGGGFNRDDRGGRSFERRDERGGHRGSDRPFNRDRQGDRPAGGGFRSGHDRPAARRDDHRATGAGSFRRDEKPRWKRNG
ncbi:RNA helicase, partial [Streptomyces sp. NPDC127077]